MRAFITAHMIVKNEEQWVWYAVSSVIHSVDRIIIYDTGSTDKTVTIVKTIPNKKIELVEKGLVTPQKLVKLRNEQLQRTNTEWFMLLDGDEVWSEAGIKEVASKIRRAPRQISAFVSKTVVPLGDLFHFQGESAGRYVIDRKKGHYNVRIYRIRNGYHWEGIYPSEAYMDPQSLPVQSKREEISFLETPYWHLTHLKRSTTDDHGKRKLEIGERKDLKIPDVFFKTRPQSVLSPWVHFTEKQRLLSTLLTPLLKLKRSFL